MGAFVMAKDRSLAAEVEAETRKKYVGKIAEAEATAQYAAKSQPGAGPGPFLLAAIGLVAIGAFGWWRVRTDSAVELRNADSPASQTTTRIGTGIRTGDQLQTAGAFVDATLQAARTQCDDIDLCGVHISTSDAVRRIGVRGIYELAYDPAQDDALAHGWQLFRSATHVLDCDVEAAFGWTREDDALGKPPTVQVRVFC
jgi:hypothetical protein